MKLPNFLDRFKKDRPAAETEPERVTPAVPASPAVAPVSPPISETEVPAEEDAGGATGTESIQDAFAKLKTIREALSRSDEVVHVPCRALLARLPEPLRGPAWKPDGFPTLTLDLEKNSLLGQLKKGRVSGALGTFLPTLPPGWVQQKPDATVDLDLAQVVAAIPPEWLAAASRPSKAMIEVADMPDFFSPKEPAAPAEALAPAPAAEPPAVVTPPPARQPELPPVVQPAPAVVQTPARAEEPPPVPEEAVMPPLPAPVPAAAPAAVPSVAAPAAAAEPVSVPAPAAAVPAPIPAPVVAEEPASAPVVPEPKGWDGLERTLDSAVLGVDINVVDVAELQALPGVGPVRAQAIVADRQAHGHFKNVYELLRVPGIGHQIFRQMTGLSASSGRDRRETLNLLLGLEPLARPSLTVVANAVADAVGATGCVLTNADGIPLAVTPSVGDKAPTYAALTVQLFRRSSTSLCEITGGKVDCIALPTAKPPRILCSVNDVYLIVVFDSQAHSQRATRKLTKLAHELGWFLGRRAVVRAW